MILLIIVFGAIITVVIVALVARSGSNISKEESPSDKGAAQAGKDLHGDDSNFGTGLTGDNANFGSCFYDD